MRCNLIDPSLLTDQHLIAEKRELRMIPPLLKKKLSKGLGNVLNSIPPSFVLGKGHMSFWLNKGFYLEKRFNSIHREMIRRGFNPSESITFNFEPFLLHREILYLDYIPSKDSLEKIKERLTSRFLEKPSWYKFCGRSLTNDLDFYHNSLKEDIS
jgi:deoxyribonuclease (pyrimidine dimer)